MRPRKAMTTNNNVALPELAATTDKHGTRLEKPRQLRQNSRTAPKGCKDEDNSIAWLEVAVTTSEGDEQPRRPRQRNKDRDNENDRVTRRRMAASVKRQRRVAREGRDDKQSRRAAAKGHADEVKLSRGRAGPRQRSWTVAWP